MKTRVDYTKYIETMIVASEGVLLTLSQLLSLSMHQTYRELQRLGLLETFYKQREYKGWEIVWKKKI